MKRIEPVLILAAVWMMAACSTLQPANVSGIDGVIGDKLPGAQGLTIKDQDRIDDTVARACAVGLYDQHLCNIHTDASNKRRQHGGMT